MILRGTTPLGKVNEMSLKIVTVPGMKVSEKKHRKTSYMGVWMGDEDSRPEGAFNLAGAREKLKLLGFEPDTADCLLFKNEEQDAFKRLVHIQHTCLPEQGVLVTCSNKSFLDSGGMISTSSLYDKLYNYYESKEGRTVRTNKAVMQLARWELGRRDTQNAHSVPIGINLPNHFCDLHGGTYVPSGSWEGPVVLYTSNYRDYGIFQWPIDEHWEVNPINGSRAGHGMSQEQQFLYNMAALELLSEISFRVRGLGWRSVVSLCDTRMYASAIFSPKGHERLLKALDQLKKLLRAQSGRDESEKDNKFLLYEFHMLKLLATSWHNVWDSPFGKILAEVKTDNEEFAELRSYFGQRTAGTNP